jgi:hypothetical protein
MKAHKGIPALFFLGFAALAFPGCATQPAEISQADSGKPNVVIASRDVDTMKSSLISEMVGFGYHVDKDTPSLLELSRTTTDTITAHAVGTVDSPHERVIAYAFIKQGVSTRVIVDLLMRAQLPGGQVDTMSLNDNGTLYGLIQKQIERLKEEVETGRSGQ